MVGGKVVETILCERDGQRRIWINVRGTGSEHRDHCAIYVEDSHAAQCVEVGDSLWWQGQHAFWTPRKRHFEDYKLRRIGYSGVARPHPGEIAEAAHA